MIEALKAYRTEDGRILLFRPDENAKRMQIGAQRLCLPSPSVEQFVDAIKLTALANKNWVLRASPSILLAFIHILYCVSPFLLRLEIGASSWKRIIVS